MATYDKVYLEDLWEMAEDGWQNPACDHQDDGPVFLHGPCHPGGDLEVSFAPGSDYVLVGCRECHEPIARIAVAWRHPVEAC